MKLFVCSQSFLRSRTAELLCFLGGVEARCAGTDKDALYPINQGLIRSASEIYCMEEKHRVRLLALAEDEFERKQLAERTFVLNIADEYSRFDPELCALLVLRVRGLDERLGEAMAQGCARYVAAGLAAEQPPTASPAKPGSGLW